MKSRTESTRKLSEAAAQHRVPALLNASAISYYSPCTERAAEDAPAGTHYLAHLVQQWEKATQVAHDAGVRTVLLRIGMVVTHEGRPLSQMMPPPPLPIFPMANDCLPFPWISRFELCRMMLEALENPEWEGAFNAVTPERVGSASFFRDFAKGTRRSFVNVPIPRFAVSLFLGQMGEEFLQVADVMPQKACELGFEFEHPSLLLALQGTEALRR